MRSCPSYTLPPVLCNATSRRSCTPRSPRSALHHMSCSCQAWLEAVLCSATAPDFLPVVLDCHASPLSSNPAAQAANAQLRAEVASLRAAAATPGPGSSIGCPARVSVGTQAGLGHGHPDPDPSRRQSNRPSSDTDPGQGTRAVTAAGAKSLRIAELACDLASAACLSERLVGQKPCLL